MARPEVVSTLPELIGKTPLWWIPDRGRWPSAVRIGAKLEDFNPGGSVKDRAALGMIRDGERSGRLTKDRTILDSSSGNTAIALAMIGRALGYRVTLVLPENVSRERKAICRALGAEIAFSDPLEGSDGALRMARRLAAEAPERYFYTRQYDNPANPRAHYETTAPEIWEQTKGGITHFVAGLGTSGTLVGTGRRLKELNPGIQVIAVEPEGGMHGIEGLKHIPSAIRPEIYDETVHDRKLSIPTDEAYRWTEEIEREGLLPGHSSGAALWGAVETARALTQGVVVTVFPDGGDRYLSLSEPG